MKSAGANNAGFTIVELLAVVMLVSVVSMIAVSNIRVLENPLTNASANLSHYFRLIRARAIAQTRSIKVTPHGYSQITAASASSCDSTTFTEEEDLTLDLDRDVSLGATDWEVCFNQRGLSDAYVLFTITGESGARSIEIALGGGVRIQ